MGQCKLCGRKGLFLSLSRNGLCNGCEEFFVLDLKNRVRIIDDCVRLITTSKNIDTRLKRCDLLEEQYKVLLEYQEKGILIPGGVNPSDSYQTCKAIREEIIKGKLA
jgi:hypothetical protein